MSNLINRQQAIDAMNGLPKYFDKTGTLCLDYADVLAVLTEHLPPAQPDLPIKEKCAYCPHCENCDVNDDLSIAQPEIVRCKDCKYRMPYDWMFSEIWRSQNINDYSEDEIGCEYCDMAMRADDFCSRAERRMEKNE